MKGGEKMTKDLINKECPQCLGIMVVDEKDGVIYCVDCGYEIKESE